MNMPETENTELTKNTENSAPDDTLNEEYMALAEQVVSHLRSTEVELTEEVAERRATNYKRLYDALMAKDFSSEEALAIITSCQLT